MKSSSQLSKSLSDLATIINEQHQQAEECITAGFYYALNAGQALTEAKQQLPHGQFADWVTKNCQCSNRSAQRYMRAVKRWPEIQERSKATPVSHLTLNEGLTLISESFAVDDDLVPQSGHMAVGTTELADDIVEIVVRPNGDGRWYLVVFGPFDPNGGERASYRFEKLAVHRHDVRQTLERLSPTGIDLDAVAWRVSRTAPGLGDHPFHRPGCEYREPQADDRAGQRRAQEERIVRGYQMIDEAIKDAEEAFENQGHQNGSQTFDDYLMNRYGHEESSLDVLMDVRRHRVACNERS